MKRSSTITAALLCVAVLSAGATFAAKRTTVPRPPKPPRVHAGKGGEHRITPDQKAASDAHVRDGLAQEQAALAALQSGNSAGAVSDLEAAYNAMKQAMPIYRGFRAKSMSLAKRAARQLTRRKNPNPANAIGFINQAISDAQTALSQSSLTITPRDRT